MVGAVVCSWRLIALKDEPSASIRINLARNTYPAGRARDWAMLLRSDCCCLGEQDFAASSHDSFDANSLVMVTLRQVTSSVRVGFARWPELQTKQLVLESIAASSRNRS